jgi:hypothetical protein
MTAILTDVHLKVIHPRCILNIKIKLISPPSNTKGILNNLKKPLHVSAKVNIHHLGVHNKIMQVNNYN